MTHTITLTLNGSTDTHTLEPRETLADFIRDRCGLTATHLGCEHGACGACTVRVGGEIVRSCLMLAVQVDGMSVETIEGLSDSGEIADLQESFRSRNALQCGFCTPGMLMTLTEFLAHNEDPTAEEVRDAISGNLCRCTGYQSIVAAALQAARVMREQGT